MAYSLLSTGLYLLLVSPIIFFNRLKNQQDTVKSIVLFLSFVFINSILLSLPNVLPFLRFDIHLSWNWFGKLYALIGSILFLFLLRKRSLSSFFITFKQNQGSLKASLIVVLLVLVLSVVLAALGSAKELNIETLLFQLSMPGFDEEIAFRGIMLGLLLPVLKSNIKLGRLKLGNPAVLVTAILFGFVHSLFVSKGIDVEFNLISFVSTGVYGYVLAWLTKKTGSILFPIIIHNLGNFLPFFISMIFI